MYLLKKAQALPRVDEFAFVLLAGIVLMFILVIVWTTPTEPVPLVTPTSVELTIQKGTSSSFKLNITGTVLTNVTLTASGAMSNWISFSKNNFNVAGSTLVIVTIKVPTAASEGLYTGHIKVESPGGSQIVSMNVEVTKAKIELSSHSIVLGDFSISYTVGSEKLDSEENVDVVKSYFSGNQINLVGRIPEDKLETVTGGHIKLKVGDTNSAGNLVVLFNGEEIFNRKVTIGEIDVAIDKSKIKLSNTVTITATSPGWMFWTNTVYRFNSIEFLVDYRGLYPKTMSFYLDSEQANNFDHLHLFYRVPPGGYSLSLPEMVITINNQLVYLKRPPLTFFNETFKKDILGNDLVLNEGENTISFSFEKNAFYEVKNAILTIYYLS